MDTMSVAAVYLILPQHICAELMEGRLELSREFASTIDLDRLDIERRLPRDNATMGV